MELARRSGDNEAEIAPGESVTEGDKDTEGHSLQPAGDESRPESLRRYDGTGEDQPGPAGMNKH